MNKYLKDKKEAQKKLDRIWALTKGIKKATDASLDTLNTYFTTDNLVWGWEGSNLSMCKTLQYKIDDAWDSYVTKFLPVNVEDEGQSGYYHGQFNYPYKNATLDEILNISDEEIEELEKALEELKKESVEEN